MSILNDSITMTSNYTLDSGNWLLRSSLWSLRIVCPLFILLSPISNWACIRIFQSRIYAKSSSKWYFIFIAIFDTIYVLVTAPLLLLITLEIYILNWNVLLCKSIVFLNYLSCQISAGLLACLSIDRLIATSCLSLYRRTCTTHLSKIICLVVVIGFSIINSHYLVGYNIDSHGFCNIKRYKWYEDNYTRLNVVYLLSYSIIPFTIITICNLFIALSVCQNKTNMKKKYDIRKSTLIPNSQIEHSVICQEPDKKCDKPGRKLKVERNSTEKHSTNGHKNELLVLMKNEKMVDSIVDSKFDNKSHRESRLSEKLLLANKESPTISETTAFIENKQLRTALQNERALATSSVSASTQNSQKMCIQLQITISLLVISICFIFCTLPNCISTIMIQAYSNDEHVRKFWQAMNYFSIVPLLTTHSVNLVFYYLSSNMFRERFKEYYLKKNT